MFYCYYATIIMVNKNLHCSFCDMVVNMICASHMHRTNVHTGL